MKSLSDRTYKASITDVFDHSYSDPTRPNRVIVKGATITCSTFVGADFRGLDLEEVDFSGSEFYDCDFRGCTFKRVNLREVTFSRSNFVLTNFVETDVSTVRKWMDCKGEVIDTLAKSVIKALTSKIETWNHQVEC